MYLHMSIDDLATANSYYRDVSFFFMYLFEKKSIEISISNFLTVGGSAILKQTRIYPNSKS